MRLKPLTVSNNERYAAANNVFFDYGVLNIGGDVSTHFKKLYYEEIAHLWPRERKLIDPGYQELYFPFGNLPEKSQHT